MPNHDHSQTLEDLLRLDAPPDTAFEDPFAAAWPDFNETWPPLVWQEDGLTSELPVSRFARSGVHDDLLPIRKRRR